MGLSSHQVLLLSNEAADKIALPQMFDNHTDGIVLKVRDDQPASWDDYALVVSRTPIPNCPVPTLVLSLSHNRIGQIMDSIEGQLLKIDDQTDVAYKQYTLLGQSNVLTLNDKIIELTQTEKNIIAALIQAGDHGLDRDVLLKNIWNYRADLDTHTLETHIYRLRQKIEDDPANPTRLCTISNGYRLV